MREILVSDDEDPAWSVRMKETMAALRAEHQFLRDEASPMIVGSSEITWWTYAGGRANLLLAKMLETELGGAVTARNESMTLEGEAGLSVVRVRQWLDELRATGRPNVADAARFAPLAAKARLSKFEPCLPEGALARLQASIAVDLEGARRVVARAGGVTHEVG